MDAKRDAPDKGTFRIIKPQLGNLDRLAGFQNLKGILELLRGGRKSLQVGLNLKQRVGHLFLGLLDGTEDAIADGFTCFSSFVGERLSRQVCANHLSINRFVATIRQRQERRERALEGVGKDFCVLLDRQVQRRHRMNR